MDWIGIVMTLMGVQPKVKTWIDIGLSVFNELQKEDPKVIPILADAGKTLFPAVTKQIDIVQAAAEALLDPNGTKWLQASLNKLQNAGLDVDGAYGPKTRAAVEAFQKAHQPASGLVDGWAGRITVGVIQSELAKQPAPK